MGVQQWTGRGRYFGGPYTDEEIQRAARAGGKALLAYLILHRKVKTTKKAHVTVSPSLMRGWGISKNSTHAILKRLVAQGFLEVVEPATQNRAPRVRLPLMVEKWQDALGVSNRKAANDADK